MTEKVIQSKIIKYAEKRGWYVVKNIRTTKNGFPDLTLLKDAISIFIEVKTPTGIHSPLQKLRQKELIKLGFECLVMDNIEDFKNYINEK